jgi:integrase
MRYGWNRTVKRAGLGPEATPYSLRHSSITRQLKLGTPIRLVAVAHDTSVGQIEANYSARIADHADAILRRGLLDVAEPAANNVVALRALK